MKHPDYNTLFYSITDIKQKCSDALAPKVCDAIDGVIARLEKKHGVEIDPNKPECDGVPGKF